MNLETIAQINELRRKGIAGTLTQEDMKQGIALLRSDRRSASVASEKSIKTKAVAEIPNADDLLSELGGL